MMIILGALIFSLTKTIGALRSCAETIRGGFDQLEAGLNGVVGRLDHCGFETGRVGWGIKR
jgi:hypothetical protein